ncbi:hypothetical protein KFZ56_17790 [Virgibacillus sp. NKC19-3]|uniref:nitronate monooxygenase n=1 Tax=Virgibacillus saliphilus TaxID=2831674 RepID=UPI001C9A9B7F|nr:nitronate monooxygenase [Virgibacillus sp. NKC19-3]MBY7144871.1 hypothetical protein [Virgibacillus sp. NKC19-3]
MNTFLDMVDVEVPIIQAGMAFVREVEASHVELLLFPIENELTKDIRAAGKKQGIEDFQSLWAGQGVGAVQKEETAEEIINDFVGKDVGFVD